MRNWLFISNFWVNNYLLLFNTFPMAISMLNFEFWAGSYGYLNNLSFQWCNLVHGFFQIRVKLALGSMLDPFFRFTSIPYLFMCRYVQLKIPWAPSLIHFLVLKKKCRVLAPFLWPPTSYDQVFDKALTTRCLSYAFGLWGSITSGI